MLEEFKQKYNKEIETVGKIPESITVDEYFNSLKKPDTLPISSDRLTRYRRFRVSEKLLKRTY
jgi:hypothetical protein